MRNKSVFYTNKTNDAVCWNINATPGKMSWNHLILKLQYVTFVVLLEICTKIYFNVLSQS